MAAKLLVTATIKGLSAFALLWAYHQMACWLNHKYIIDYEYICNSSVQADSILIVTSYVIVDFVGIFRKKVLSVIRYFLFVIGLYVAVYGLISVPYMIISFLQPIDRNTLYHFLLTLVILELAFRYAKNPDALRY